MICARQQCVASAVCTTERTGGLESQSQKNSSISTSEMDTSLLSLKPTPWISNMVVIAKPDKLRICIDPKHLNQALQRSHYHMPTLEDILYKLPKARLFTLADVRDAFLHCRLDNESSLMTTFWTPWGRMRWCKLSFGCLGGT